MLELVVVVVAEDRLSGIVLLDLAALVPEDLAYIEVTVGTTFLEDDLGASEVGECKAVRKLVHEFHDLVVVVGEVHSCLPAEVVAELLVPAGGHLDTLVLHITGVHIAVAQTGLVRRGYGEELVLGVGLVPGGGDVEPVVEEGSVETGLDGVGHLRLEGSERSAVRSGDRSL